MANPLVSIIILTYKNGLKDVKKCLISLSAVSYKPFEIILVDNASTDNTVIYIEKHFPNVKVIQNRWNMGFCTGNNQGLEIAKGKYILFFNNDAIATPDFLSILVEEFVKDNKLGAIQPKIRQLRDKSLLDACASYLTNTGFLYHYGYSQNQANQKYNKKLYMYSVKGACFLARKSLIDRIGLFDDDYFAYFEETDFCHRVWLSGFKIGYLPSSEIYHLGGAGKEASPFIQFHSYKNRIHTYLKNFELWPLVKILSETFVEEIEVLDPERSEGIINRDRRR